MYETSMRRRVGFTLAFAAAQLLLGASAALAQTAVINGRVTNEQAQPLEGANVFIANMNISITTGADGRYTITIPAARVTGQSVPLRARSIGYIAQAKQITITVGTQTRDFVLTKDINRLEAV